MEKIHPTRLRPNFLLYCRKVAKLKTRLYAGDRRKRCYLVIDSKARLLPVTPIEASAQFFKDNFARCSGLVKSGFAFRLALRNGGFVYARRHSSYSDPLDDVLGDWWDALARELLQKRQNELRDALDVQSEEFRAQFQILARGMARMAIGHRPFDEGLILQRQDMDEQPPDPPDDASQSAAI